MVTTKLQQALERLGPGFLSACAKETVGVKKKKKGGNMFPPFHIAVGKCGFQTTPRLCSPTTMRPGLKARLNTSSALRGSASPHMNTSNAA